MNELVLKLNRLSVLLFALLLTQQLSAQIRSSMDSLIHLHVKEGFNGNVYYSKNDSVIYKRSFGVSNFETNSPLNDSTLFELASNSKQFTALATIQLIENGKLKYQTDVQKILPAFPYKNITVEHLLRHQSGLPEYANFMDKKKVWNRDSIANNEDVFSILCQLKPKLHFTPGSQFKYNNTAYVILALIIEKISGQTYSSYLEERIFQPLNMRNTQVILRKYAPVNIPNNTEGYFKSGKGYEIMNNNKRFICGTLNGTYGDAGISSTVLDLEKWKQALRTNTLISSTNKSKMFSTDSISTGYGMGFFVRNNSFGEYVYHSGGYAGYISWCTYKPSTNEYIVILCNNDYVKSVDILLGIYKIILSQSND